MTAGPPKFNAAHFSSAVLQLSKAEIERLVLEEVLLPKVVALTEAATGVPLLAAERGRTCILMTFFAERSAVSCGTVNLDTSAPSIAMIFIEVHSLPLRSAGPPGLMLPTAQPAGEMQEISAISKPYEFVVASRARKTSCKGAVAASDPRNGLRGLPKIEGGGKWPKEFDPEKAFAEDDPPPK